ncbi:MAG: dynamin family protein [Anaerovibrio sp.]|uniref:dynamin family protein n=1 Tax=Anaerovibrio sp. TaxID=1872532 RepID=UPI0025E5A48E|nr:dynamin family protein [Anaerovibrio sp.]MCR5175246.1 dynamin family protein [Anaerovibrio sp.]
MEKEILTNILENLRSFRSIISEDKEFKVHVEDLDNLLMDAEEPLLIMVMGHFSAGKSTFINALVGKEIAAMNATPTTAVITKLCYGVKDEIIVHYRDGAEEKKKLEDFASLTAEADEESNQLHESIDYVERRMPFDVLRSVTIIDSPGINSIKSAHGVATRRFMDKADTVLWMFDAQNAGSQTEIDAMEELSPRLKPIALVNKMDQVDEEEESPEELLDNIRGLLGDRVQAVVGISAELALRGKLQHDEELLEESCIKDFYNIIQREILPNRDNYKMNTLLDDMVSFTFSIGKKIEDKEKGFEEIKEKDYSAYIAQQSDLAPIKDGFEDLAEVFYDHCQNQRKNLVADVFVGILYRFGLVVEKNEAKAVQRMERAAVRHDKNAQMVLMMHYFHCEDYEKALFWARHGSKDNNDDCQAFLGVMLLYGIGVDRNLAEALENFKLAAAQGNADGQYGEGYMYLYGLGGSEDNDHAYQMLSKAAFQGEEAAFRELGNCHLNGWGVEKSPEKAFEYYKKAVDKGDDEAVVNLGLCYAKGVGITADFNKALEYLQKAVELKNNDALVFLGNLYWDGNKVDKDEEKAFSYFRQAAEQESGEAQYNLSVFYREGIATEKNEEISREWLFKAVKNEDPNALYQQSIYLADGDGIDKDEAAALRMLIKAADAGILEAKVDYADCLNYGILNSPIDKQRAIELYQIGVQHNNPVAQYNMALFYDKGEIVDKDITRSIELLSEAAKGDYAPAQYYLGLAYSNGYGVDKDEKQAFSLFEAAAKQKNYSAMYQLGICYLYGKDVANDEVKGASLLKEAAINGNVNAQRELAYCYINGKGVPEDASQSFNWLEKAAQQDDGEAAKYLGLSYKNGIGTSKDASKAFYWMKKARDLGEEEADRYLGIFYYQGIGVQTDNKAAFQCMKNVVDNGDLEATGLLGGFYLKGIGVDKNLKEAARLLNIAKEKGNVEACLMLGMCYEDGLGLEKDDAKAFACYRIVVQTEAKGEANYIINNCGAGAYNLGRCYEYGIGTEPDINAAAQWYKNAISQGNTEAKEAFARIEKIMQRRHADERMKVLQLKAASKTIEEFFEMGQLYQHEYQNSKAAFDCYLNAATKGHFSAMVCVGRFYQEGIIVNDPRIACKWFFNAAEGGSSEGEYYYGLSLINGNGIEKDYNRGLSYLRLAKSHGNGAAADYLSSLGFGELKKQSCIIKGATQTERYVLDIAKKLKQRYPFDAHVYYIVANEGEEYEKTVRKFRNAMESYAILQEDELPILCYDSTVTGTARDGLLASNKALYVHNYTEDTVVIPYSLASVIEYKLGMFTNHLYSGEFKINTAGMLKDECIAFCNVLNEIITTFKTAKICKESVEWLCTCGEKNSGNFCTKCGNKRQD